MNTYQTTNEATPLIGSSSSIAQSNNSLENSNEVLPGLDDVRSAFAQRDIFASVLLHNQRLKGPLANEEHMLADTYSEYTALLSTTIQAVFITLSIITIGFCMFLNICLIHAISASVPLRVIFGLSVTQAIIAGFGLSCNDVLNLIAERQFVSSEISREQWEMEVNLTGEISEMVGLYAEMGMSKEHAQTIWETYSNYPRLFLQAMLAEECRIILPSQPLHPQRMTLYRCIAFFCGAVVPYIPLVVLYAMSVVITFDQQLHVISLVISSLFTLFFLGAQRSRFFPTVDQNPPQHTSVNNGIQLVLVGIICTIVSFIAGKLLKQFVL